MKLRFARRFIIIPCGFLPLILACATPKLAGVGEVMQGRVDEREIAGAVTVVASRTKVLHLEATGYADLRSRKPMREDNIFWIASMTKPVTGVALLMLQDEGKLSVHDPVAKYVPEFANLRTPSDKPADLTILQIMSHVSGLGEAPSNAAARARTLSDLIPIYLAQPMQYEPGERWKYTQSGINTGARIVEIVSGLPFDQFLQQRLFDPLGMKDTTFYPTAAQRQRMATAYQRTTDSLVIVQPRADVGKRTLPPLGNSGLFSTGPDYIRFLQMLLNDGVHEGRRYLSPESVKFLGTNQTGDLPTGFLQNERDGSRGKNYGWSLGACVLREPHPGVAEMLSPGSFGHGGAWGTQAWIDSQRGVAYLLMIQRANSGNADNSEIRRTFQNAASAALPN